MSIQFGTDGYLNWPISLVLDPNDPYASFSQGTFKYDFPVDGLVISGLSGAYNATSLTYSASAPVTISFNDPMARVILNFAGAEQKIQGGQLVVQSTRVRAVITYDDGTTGTGTFSSSPIWFWPSNKSIVGISLSQIVDDGWTSTGTVSLGTSMTLSVEPFNFYSRTSSTVDLNNLTPDQLFLLSAGGQLARIADGDRTVTLLDAPIHIDWTNSTWYQPDTRYVSAGSGTQIIQAGLTTERIYFGPDKNIVYAAPNADYMPAIDSSGMARSPTGVDIVDFQHGKFANFSQFAPNRTHSVLTSHSEFQLEAGKQSVLLLPGSSNEYKITHYFFHNVLSNSRGEITTIGGGPHNLPQGIALAENFERVKFANPYSGPAISLKGGSIASEMLQLAGEVYGPAFPQPAHTVPQLHGTEALAYDGNTWSGVASTAAGRNWRPMSAIELGMAPADFNQFGDLRYTFIGGAYQAVRMSVYVPAFELGEFKVENALIDGAAVGGDPAQATALVLEGMVNGKRTLSVVFRGTDQGADMLDFLDFETHYSKFAPLVDAIKKFAVDEANDIQQILISGHSLGAAAAQYLLHDLPDTASYKVQAYTMGSPGAEERNGDRRIINFFNSDDPIPIVGSEVFNALKHVAISLLSELIGKRLGPAGEELVSNIFKQIKDKHHEGSSVTFHNDVGVAEYDIGAGQSLYSLSIGHNYSLYEQEVEVLHRFAVDQSSPFSRSALAQSLVNGTVFQGDISIGLAGVGFSQSQVAPYTSTVHVRFQDDYVLGTGGGRIVWDLPTVVLDAAVRTLLHKPHIVDGGNGKSNVVLPGSRDMWSVQTKQTEFGPETDLRFAGGLIAELYRVKDLIFPFYPGSNEPVIRLDGSAPVVFRPQPALVDGGASLQNNVVIPSGYDYSDLGDRDLIVMGSGTGDIIAIGRGNHTINEFTGDSTIFVKDPTVAGDLLVSVKAGTNLVITGRGNDLLYGGAGGVDTFAPGGGINRINGGGGQAVLLLEAPQEEFQFSSQIQSDGVKTTTLVHTGPTGSDGTDILIGVQTLKFIDATVSLALGTASSDTIKHQWISFVSGFGGADAFVFDGLAYEQATAEHPAYDRISDFNRGNSATYQTSEGDQIDVAGIVASAYAQGVGQPVQALVRAFASDTFALLQVDKDGTAGGTGWVTVARLEGLGIGKQLSVVVDGTQAAKVITVQAAPADLDVLNTMMLSSETVVAFGTATVKYTVANSGASPVGASKVGFYRSSDTTFDATDTLLSERSFGQINAQTHANDNFALTLNAVGTYYIIAVADYNDQFPDEATEINNASNAVQVTVSDSETIHNSDGSRTEHRVDALNQFAYRDYFINFDALGRATSQLTNNDDGSRIVYAWDAQNQTDWADYNLSYDPQNRITGQVTHNDDRSYIVFKWDVANQSDWTDYRVTYDAQDRPITQVTHNDDASQIVFKWDVANQAEWTDYRVTYDSQNRPISQVTNNDNGSRIVFQWDVANQFNWSDYRVTTDAQGRAVSQVTNNDNGTHLTYGWDVQNQASWSDYVVTTDSQNRATTQTTHYDNGNYAVAKWDVLNQFNWASMTDTYNAQGQHLSQQGVYDNGTTWMT